MKAITLYQPWATLAVTGAKKIETRGRLTNIRGTIAIHAAKTLSESAKIWTSGTPEIIEALSAINMRLSDLPLGAVIGTVELIDCVPIESLYGTAYDTHQERAFGDWNRGRYGWILQNPVIFDNPIPAKGHQGWWNWDKEKEAAK